MLIMEALFVLMAATLANSSPRCSVYCQISSSAESRPVLSCDCHSLAVEKLNCITYRFKGQASSATLIFPNHKLKRWRRILYNKSTKNYIQRPFMNSNYTYNDSKNNNYDISFVRENNAKDLEVHKFNSNDMKINIENLFNCIHLHYILFKRKKNSKFNKIGKLNHDNIYRFLNEIKLMNNLNVKYKKTFQVLDTNKKVKGGWKTQKNCLFNYLRNISLEINNVTKVTYNINSNRIQLIRIVISILYKEHIALQQSSKNSHSNISSDSSHSTISLNSTALSPPTNHYDFAIDDETINKKLSPSKLTQGIMKLDDGEIHSGQKGNTSLIQNKKTHIIFKDYDILNTSLKPLLSLNSTVEYSQSSKENESFQNIDNTTAMSIKKVSMEATDITTNTYKENDVVSNIHNKSLITVTSIPPLNILKSTITPLKIIKASTTHAKLIGNLSNTVKLKKDNTKSIFKKTNLRLLYNETEIPIIRVVSREYPNNSVSSFLNGTETMPSNDFEEAKKQNDLDAETTKTKKYIYGVYIPISSTTKFMTPMAIKGKLKHLNISRKLYFIEGNQEVPTRFFQDPGGNIQVGVHVLDIYDKVDKEK